MEVEKPFRMQALEVLLDAFGPAREIPVDQGCLYRWVFTRGGRREVYVTLDSPEMPQLAHLMISDLGSTALNPITTVIMRTLPEVHAAAEAIRRQVEGGCR
jgi:hypothetical protein